MTTLTIEIEESEKEFLKKVLTKLNVKIVSEIKKTPNKLTQETIKKAEMGKGLGKPFSNVKSFMDSL